MSLSASMRQRDCPVCGASAAAAALFLERSLDEKRLTTASFASRKTPDFMSYHLVRCPACGVRPCGWTELSGCFDRLPGVLVFELRGAEIAQRRM